MAACTICLVLVALSVPIANFGSDTTQEAIPVTRQLSHDVRRGVPKGDPVLVAVDMSVWPYLSGALLGLQENGIEFRFTDAWALRTYGNRRAYSETRDGRPRELLVTSTFEPPDRGTLISLAGPGLRGSRGEYVAVRRRLLAWERSLRQVRFPRSAPVSSSARALIDSFLARSLARATSRNQSIFDQPDVANLLTTAAGRPLLDTFDVPGLSPQELRAWMRDQSIIVQGRAVFAYLR